MNTKENYGEINQKTVLLKNRTKIIKFAKAK